MATQVGVGEVAIVPTIKGFRRAVGAEVDATTKSAKGVFENGFASAGVTAGNTAGKGFHGAFAGQTSKTTADLTKAIQRDVAKASREVSQARLREQDAAGKVRLAEVQLAETRKKYASESSQVVRAEERLQSAQRQLAERQQTTKGATDRLTDSQGKLASETDRVEREMRDAARAADDAGDEFRQAGSQASSATGEMSNAGQAGATGFLGSMKGGLTKVGGVVAGALIAADIAGTVADILGAAVREAVGYVRDSISIASDLEQSMGAVDQVFKGNAATIKSWAADGAQSVGLSQGKYQEFATVVGAQLKNMGLPLDDVTGKTGDLIALGADLAAQFGGSTSDAVSALSSLLRGERDPIERYGVSIKQADINARLAAKGLSGLEGDALKAAEANETLAMVYDQTADAAGTFARESGTLAGQQQRLTAEWENAQAKLGAALLPALTELATIANEELVPVLNDVIDQVGPQLGKAFADAAPAIGDMLVELAPLIPELAGLAVDVLPVLVEFLTLTAPLLVSMADGWGFIATNVSALFGLLSGDKTLDEFGARIVGSDSKVMGFVRSVSGAAGTVNSAFQRIGFGSAQLAVSISTGIQSAISAVSSLPGRALAALGNLGSLLVVSGRSLIQGFINGIDAMIGSAGAAAARVVDWVRGFFPFSPAKRGPLSGAGWSRLAGSGEAYIAQWTAGVERGATAFTLPDMVRSAAMVSLDPVPTSGHVAQRGQGRGEATTVVEINGNVYGDPEHVAEEIDRRKRRANAVSGIGDIR